MYPLLAVAVFGWGGLQRRKKARVYFNGNRPREHYLSPPLKIMIIKETFATNVRVVLAANPTKGISHVRC